MEQLKQERVQLAEEKAGLYRQTERLAQESAYAKELAAQAAVELKNLAQELTKLSFLNTKLQNDLMQAQQVTFQNAKLQNELAKLQNELTKAQDQAFARTALKPASLVGRTKQIAGSDGQVGDETALGVGNNHIRMGQNYSNGDGNLSSRNQKMNNSMNVFDDINMCQLDPKTAILELKKELELAHNRESIMEATMAGKEERETLLQKELDHAKHRESVLENDLAGMWVLVAKLKKEKDTTKYQPVFTDVQDCCQEDCQTVGRVAVRVASSPESMWQGCTKNGNFKDI
jgi:centromeric protein E